MSFCPLKQMCLLEENAGSSCSMSYPISMSLDLRRPVPSRAPSDEWNGRDQIPGAWRKWHQLPPGRTKPAGCFSHASALPGVRDHLRQSAIHDAKIPGWISRWIINKSTRVSWILACVQWRLRWSNPPNAFSVSGYGGGHGFFTIGR